MVRIVFHSADLDGHASGAIARYYFEYIKGTAYTMYGYNYGQVLDRSEWEKDDKVYFLDCAVQPKEEMIQIMKDYSVTLIDHHKSTSDLMEYSTLGVHSLDKSGCELAWEYFFQDRIPNFISLLGRYDIYDQSDMGKWRRRILPFHYGMMAYRTNPFYDDGFEIWNQMIGKVQDRHFRDLDDWIDDTTYKGKIAQKATEEVYRYGASAQCHDAEFEGLRAVVANSFVKSSQFFGKKYNPEEHDVMVAWTYNGKYGEYSASIFTTREDLDLEQIAKKFGGGGHKQAAGFGCKHISFKDGKMIIEAHE